MDFRQEMLSNVKLQAVTANHQYSQSEQHVTRKQIRQSFLYINFSRKPKFNVFCQSISPFCREKEKAKILEVKYFRSQIFCQSISLFCSEKEKSKDLEKWELVTSPEPSAASL